MTNAIKIKSLFLAKGTPLKVHLIRLKLKDMVHRWATFLFSQDLDLDSHPVSLNKYLLKGENENMIRKSNGEILQFIFCEKTGYWDS